MAEERAEKTSLFAELHHRQVFKTAGIYLGSAWLVTEILLTVIEHSVLSPQVQQTWKSLVVIVFVGGFPPAMLLAWFLDWYKGGIQRERRWRGASRAAVIAAVALLAGSTGVVFAGLLWIVNPGQWIHAEPLYAAVLPCRYRGTPDDAWLGDAVAREINDRMARLALLRVPAWPSVKAVSAMQTDPVKLAGRLGVRRLVDCDVTRDADHLALTMQMYRPEAKENEWTRRFEGHADDILRLIGESTQQLVVALAPNLAPDDIERANRLPTANVLAWEEFARGLEAITAEESSSGAALAHFTAAAQNDPDFARPLAWIARIHWEAARALSRKPDARPEDARARLAAARAYVQRALNVDPLSAEALAMKRVLTAADVQASNDKKVDPYALHRQIMSLRPSFADELEWWSDWLRSRGEDNAADAALAESRRLNPAGSGE